MLPLRPFGARLQGIQHRERGRLDGVAGAHEIAANVDARVARCFAFGEDGVAAALRMIDDELVSAMRQAGVTSVAGITKASLMKRAV